MNKLAKREWESFCSKLDPRKPLSRIWLLLRSLRTPQIQLHPFKSISLSTNTSDLQVADASCRRITAAPAALLPPHSPPNEGCSGPVSPMDEPFSMAELLAALASVKKSSFPGPDDITYTTLSHLGEKGRSCLLHAFNISWETGRLEPRWKHARLVPVLKPGKVPTAIESYRPIALLSCVGKLMEKMVLLRLDWDLIIRNICPEQMSGFRKGRSSLDNVIALANSIREAKCRRNIAVAVFLDIKSAYDCVEHEAIRSALKSRHPGSHVRMAIGLPLR